MKLLILDNYDSFTYNIVHAVRSLGIEPEVRRNDEITIDEATRYDKIIISPGPGIPSEAGILPRLIDACAGEKPMLGVCLGHQAIAEHFGARIFNMPQVCHGISSEVEVVADDYIFHGLPERFRAGRYHSWAVDEASLPPSLEVTARTADGTVMALRHRTLDIHGVQFHPESVLTPGGCTIIANFINR
ncbi:aminodeoxychorismate/anthranilate synthase component II [uncultured Muribaculum sp.]|uniref:anthranilate synthase component II n=1 Tax=uncultured Muribaculum sp. TaxID=1918613 RepID=UPI0025D2BA37|nr:aminodeoxychorismate/anthranilate synthase component II [uncultured Muribaculum sp.]